MVWGLWVVSAVGDIKIMDTRLVHWSQFLFLVLIMVPWIKP